MLHRVIQQNALPFAPCDREIDGQEERETCRAALAAREDELGVYFAIDLQREEAFHITAHTIFNVAPDRVGAQPLA